MPVKTVCILETSNAVGRCSGSNKHISHPTMQSIHAKRIKRRTPHIFLYNSLKSVANAASSPDNMGAKTKFMYRQQPSESSSQAHSAKNPSRSPQAKTLSSIRFGMIGAVFEGPKANLCHRVGDFHLCQGPAATKGLVSNSSHRVGDFHLFQGSAAMKGCCWGFPRGSKSCSQQRPPLRGWSQSSGFLLVSVSELQPRKALSPILVTELGISTCVSELQPTKAAAPILVTELGISTCVSELQPRKAAIPMLVTELGISTCVRELQPSKTPCPTLVTELGISTCVSELQPKKAWPPMLVTEC